jgi:hypothetical protein
MRNNQKNAGALFLFMQDGFWAAPSSGYTSGGVPFWYCYNPTREKNK